MSLKATSFLNFRPTRRRRAWRTIRELFAHRARRPHPRDKLTWHSANADAATRRHAGER